MLAAKKSAGVGPEVNCSEHVTCVPLPSLNKADQFGIETQRRHHQNSKRMGISGPTKKGLLISSKTCYSVTEIGLLTVRIDNVNVKTKEFITGSGSIPYALKNRLRLPFLPMRSTSRRDLTQDNPHPAIPKGAFK